jgi:hypothetical protein
MINKYRYVLKPYEGFMNSIDLGNIIWDRKDIDDGSLIYFYFTIEDIEKNALQILDTFLDDGFDIISRDSYIGICDKNKKEIYENDILLHHDTNWGYGGEYDKTHNSYLRTKVPSIDILLSEDFDYEPSWFKNWENIGTVYENIK